MFIDTKNNFTFERTKYTKFTLLTLPKYTQETTIAQEEQQDLAKMAFEKLHTSQLLERANQNITSLRAILKVRSSVSPFPSFTLSFFRCSFCPLALRLGEWSEHEAL